MFVKYFLAAFAA